MSCFFDSWCMWGKFSNILVNWSLRMIRAKNYENIFKFAVHRIL